MSVKAIMFAGLGLFIAMTLTVVAMRGDVARMRQEAAAKAAKRCAQEQAQAQQRAKDQAYSSSYASGDGYTDPNTDYGAPDAYSDTTTQQSDTPSCDTATPAGSETGTGADVGTPSRDEYVDTTTLGYSEDSQSYQSSDPYYDDSGTQTVDPGM